MTHFVIYKIYYMTYFDLTSAQRAFYHTNRPELKLTSFIALCESKDHTYLPTMDEYKAFLSGNDSGETIRIDKVERHEIRSAYKKLLEEHSKKYRSPLTLFALTNITQNMKFRYYRKAAQDLYKTGLYVQAREYKNGGGYDVYKLSEQGAVMKEYEHVNPRDIEKIILELI